MFNKITEAFLFSARALAIRCYDQQPPLIAR